MASACFEELLDGRPSLSEVCEHVRVRKWFQLGIQLNLDGIELDDIREERGRGDEKRASVFQLWFRTQPKATRRQLLTALRTTVVGEYSEATKYEEMLRKKADPSYADIKLPPHQEEGSLLDHTVSDCSIYKIAQAMIKWECLSIPLGQTKGETQAMKRDYDGDYNKQKVQLLYTWRRKNGDKATYRNLINIVHSLTNELAEYIATLSGTMLKDIHVLPPPTLKLHWDDKVSDNMILKIAKEMTSWENLSIALGLTEAESKEIQKDYKEDYNQQKIQMLFKWREKRGQTEGTYNKLVEILTKFEHQNLADYISNIMKS